MLSIDPIAVLICRPKRIMLKAFRRELSLLVSHTYSLVAASSTGRIRMWHSR